MVSKEHHTVKYDSIKALFSLRNLWATRRCASTWTGEVCFASINPIQVGPLYTNQLVQGRGCNIFRAPLKSEISGTYFIGLKWSLLILGL